jgi:class 3 adenylate cyclase
VRCPVCRYQASAAAKFCEQCGEPFPSADLSGEGERRHLTVMFCDLVGSTPLAAALDPEDLHALLRRYQETCARVVTQYDGYIAQYLGDGLLVFFGYPLAHEDDAQRARGSTRRWRQSGESGSPPASASTRAPWWSGRSEGTSGVRSRSSATRST